MKVEEHLIRLCRAKQLTLGAAESCSGGAFSARLTQVPGASDVFLGSIISYSNSVKQQILGVSSKALEAGSVSELVTREMLKGALTKLKCAIAVAITGVAGPSGGTPLMPVGLVWVVMGGINYRIIADRLFLKGNRLEIIQQSVDFSFKRLVQMVNS